MDHNSSYDYYPFNHPQHPLYFNPVSPVHVPPPPPPPPGHPEPEEQKDYHHYAPASPSDFIYNANSSVNTTTAASILHHHHHRHPSRSSRSLFSNEPVLAYPPRTVGSRSVEQSFSNYLPGVLEPSLPRPAPGFEEHRRQRQSTMMTMGPGPSKSVPSPLSLPLSREGGRSGRRRMSGFSSGEETVVVIKREEEEEESVPWVSIPLEQRVKRWVPRVPQGEQGEQMKQVEEDAVGGVVGGVVGYVPLGTEESGVSGSKTWEERGEGVVMERVMMVPSVVSSVGANAGVEMVAGMMGTAMGMGMEPTITPKMGLFKPIRWDGPSSASRAKAKARRVRAWETMEEQHGDVHLRRTPPGIQNRSSNRDRNDETEDEKVSDAPISPHSRSPKRFKTSSSHSGYILRPGPCPAETKTDTEIKQEPSLSPPPSAVLAQIPMFDSFDSLPRNNSGYESSGHDDNSLSLRSISPLTRVPTPHRVLFTTTTTPNRIMTGTGTRETTQPSLRAVSKQLKKRNREMALGQGHGREDNRERSREPRKKRREEGACWGLPGGSQRQTPAQGANSAAQQKQQQQQQQQQHRESSEGREQGWTTISGSSEEGEASSHYENSYSYSFGQQERDRDAAAASSTSNPLSYTDQEEEWCRPFSFSSSSSSAAPVSFETSARYDHDYESAPPSLSASQERRRTEEEGYRQAIQMAQDTCLEASKRYIRAHCANRGARGGGSPDTSPAPRQTVSTRSARKARRKRKLETRQASSFSSSFSSSSPSTSPEAPAPSRQRRKGKGKSKRQNRTKNRTTTTSPPSSFNSPHHQSPPPPDIQIRNSLLPNISQICTLLWSRSQSLRLHDTDSIELHTARNMYWLLSWAETVAFAVVPPTLASISTSTSFTAFTVPDSKSDPDPFDSTTTISVGSSVPGFDGCSSSSSAALRQRKREWDREWEWEGFGEGVSEEGDKAEEGLESKNGRAVWEQQRIEEMIKRVFDEGGMLCEFLGYGEGVERLGRVREFCGV
ncbi:hypothetical protein GE21DRAFT_2509 [Neurospora crassa]|uniref:Uncharacterized protein n=1 Tax=Neurospora crassa (strain ATCC 24698 / 74-OR23-1A / CBS 708.71 / DSM 1257 / FGSC 987) TaxID=367110 RepID=V5IQQ7_NEUCR|nr:hypothetical protein NCU02782 [Neurospora crassa OR74A]ESA44392.1 hypothetical protein NCU02782 [Neurospora crassa OR74A]KHE87297.1 hypothetical protein GE21DRAFT_2509 [Neurospora crassa]|eukprot:XP_011393026.1 hypothetical protein NCU02782 [Neurospora crassa OR74A]